MGEWPAVTPMTDAEIQAEQERMAAQRAATEAGPHVSPVDLLNRHNYADRATRDARLDVCKACDRLTPHSHQCRECNCFMAAKTWLTQAVCPLGKW